VNHVDEAFTVMGGRGRIVLRSPDRGLAELELLAAAIRAVLDDAERCLTRFDAGSDLSRFNRGEAPLEPAPVLVRRLAVAARWAGEATDGLVDATRLGALRHAGDPRAPLAEALAAAPPRRPATAHPDRAYEQLHVGLSGAVHRPAGVQLDSGGLAKGLAADLAAGLVPRGVRYAISVGGDLAVGGGVQPVLVEPVTPGADGPRLVVPGGGVATSGVHARLWRRDDGSYAHHLLDPSAGEPAWTGLVCVTAVAPSVLEAEVLAKHALLAGPAVARRLLRRAGGVLQHDDGRIEGVAAAPVVRLRVAA
jgi:thiamine biosynthesis lipoprotein